MRLNYLRMLAILLLCGAAFAEAHLRIPLPGKTSTTPVQKLNRDGVNALQKHNYSKARELFYHAYLIDPDDPFTLNNLGYVSELQGDVDRAQRYYELARRNASDAVVAKSNLKMAEGKPFAEVVNGLKDANLDVNRYNVEAMRLLSHGRPQEAEGVLKKALATNPQSAFTLNNLGFAKENEGELQEALRYYREAADLHSNDTVIVAVSKHWRGRPISKVASENAKAVENRLKHPESTQEQVARLNLRGVSALNRNDEEAARRLFEQAYKLDPTDAFTLNNMGYLSELDGDRETADDFYSRARQANGAQSKVTMSTQRSVEGMRMGVVADVNDQKVENKIEAIAEARRAQGGPAPPQLMRRNGTPVVEPEVPSAPPGSQQPLPPQQQPSPQPEPQLTPRAPSPYSPAPPQMPAPQLPQTGQPQSQPQSQPQTVPQTLPPAETQPPPQ